jgi:hypothetical protein
LGHEDVFDYCLHYECHSSLLIVGQLAERSLCLYSNVAVASSIESDSEIDTISMVAYPADSKMECGRLPTHWIAHIHARPEMGRHTPSST